MDEEKKFYNAVSIALEGNPSAMRMMHQRLAKQCDGTFPGWVAAYEFLLDGGTVGRMEKRDPQTMPDPESEWENIEQRGIQLIFKNERGYPDLLREIYHPPLALYVLGTLGITSSITIVGTRRATPDGKTATRRFARELTQAGFSIVSGLALGIDAEAHHGCLESEGHT